MILKNTFEPHFLKLFKKLPPFIREKAIKAFKSFEESFSRGLNLEKIKGYDTLYSIRIDDNYRALGNKVGDTMYWEWIGPHDEYMRRIRG
jgi:mRNA-degrading endonuclease RelE of RelBE toxin-antitoxin system